MCYNHEQMDEKTKLEERHTIKYDINGRTYSFAVDCTDGGIPYGYSSILRKWGWLYNKFIQFSDYPEIIKATLVDGDGLL